MQPEPPGKRAHPLLDFQRYPFLLPFYAWLLLLVFNLFLTPHFFDLRITNDRMNGAIIDIFQNGAIVMLLSIGMTLVIAIGGIDLSVGSVMAIAGAVAGLMLTQAGSATYQAILLSLSVAFLAGLWNGVLVHYLGLQPIIATLVLLVTGRGIAQALTRDQKIRFDVPGFEYLGNGTLLWIPVPIFIVAAVALLVAVVLRKTALGLYIEAIGGNPRAAHLCGIRLGTLRLLTYAFCSLTAGIAGLIEMADLREADVTNSGLYMELDAILAVVIGGTLLNGGKPHLAGSLMGAILMQTLTITLLMQGVVKEQTLMIKAVAVLCVCLAQTPRFAQWTRSIMRNREAVP